MGRGGVLGDVWSIVCLVACGWCVLHVKGRLQRWHRLACDAPRLHRAGGGWADRILRGCCEPGPGAEAALKTQRHGPCQRSACSQNHGRDQSCPWSPVVFPLPNSQPFFSSTENRELYRQKHDRRPDESECTIGCCDICPNFSLTLRFAAQNLSHFSVRLLF